MKLIIDIPEDELTEDEIEEAKRIADDCFCGVKTIIPDNATNGDIIKAFYPDLVVGSNNLKKTIFLRPNATVVIEDRMSDWWNEPYKKGGKG